MPPSIWARIVSGLTARPQSIAQTTRCTVIALILDARPRATCAHKLPNEACTAMPRARPAGSGVPQPAFWAASSSTPRCRGLPASSSRRYAYGSLPAACASSSMKLSTTKPVCVWPTERHQSTGTGDRGLCRSTRGVGNLVGHVRRAFHRRLVDAVLDRIAANGVPSTTDWPTIVCFQATGLPAASSPALTEECHIGR